MKPSFFPKNKLLNSVFAVSLVCVLVITFFGQETPLIFPWGQKFEDLLLRLSYSVVPSYIFYFIVVHLKSYKDKKNLYFLLSGYNLEISLENVKLIHGIFSSAYQEKFERYYIDEHGNKIDPSNFSLKDLSNALSHINLSAKSPVKNLDNTYNLNWMDFVIKQVNSIVFAIDNLMLLSSHLDSEHIKLLYNIKTSSLVNVTKFSSIETYKPESENYVYLAPYIFDFDLSVQALHNYEMEHWEV